MLRWRASITAGLLLWVITLCGAGAAALAGREAARRPATAPRPVAYVWDYQDEATGRIGATRLLEEAGFEVWPLPLDRSPWELSGLIFIGSFASEHRQYEQYMQEYSDDLIDFVERGNVLVQMTQASEAESFPSFLPRGLRARRLDEQLEHVYVTSRDHPLLQGVPLRRDGRIQSCGQRAVWNSFAGQFGFEVILAADRFSQYPALMEGACGQGRIILSAMPFDKVVVPPNPHAPEGVAAPPAPFSVEWDSFNRAFFANLRQHVKAVGSHSAPAPTVTPTRFGGGFVRGSWTLAVLPDTQHYARKFPGVFQLQADWIVRSAGRLDIRYVLHLGDITDGNTPVEWGHARSAMRKLEGVVPLALVPGNHDYGPGGDATTRDSYLNRFFGFKEHSRQAGFGGAMEPGKLDNTFHLFEAGGRKWIVLALEWAPRPATIAWANSVMSRHTDRVGILVTHAYLNNNDRRFDRKDIDHSQSWGPQQYSTPGGGCDGEELWQALVRKHDFALVLSGHVLGDGTGYLASINDTGTTTHQILSNYQMRPMGGEGYLRLLEFLPDGRTVRVRTFSPLYEKYFLDPDQHFEFSLDQPLRVSSASEAEAPEAHQTKLAK